MEGPAQKNKDGQEEALIKKIDFLTKEIDQKRTPALKNSLLHQLEQAKKDLEKIKEDKERPETKIKELRKKIKDLDEQYKSEAQRENKALLASQLEQAKKDLTKLEEELEKNKIKERARLSTATETTTVQPAQQTTIDANTEKKKFKVGFVDTTDVMKTKARDAGDAAMTMEIPENPQELKGFKRFFKGEFWRRTGEKIWKHGLWRDYYRNKEVAKAREKILKTGNIFAGEGKEQAAHDKFVADVMEQFTSEYEEAIHRDAGETRRMNEEIENEKEIKEKVKKLIIEYASGKISKEAFSEEEGRIFNDLKADTEGRQLQKKEDIMHASNLSAIAEQIKEAMKAGTFLEEEDFDIDLIYGKSKGDVRTEAKLTKVESLAEKLSHTKIGQFVNETTIAMALSATTTAGVKIAQGSLSATAKILPFVGTALVSSGFAKIREAKKVEEERRQHAREMARGEKFDPAKMERRREMEESRYSTMKALDLIKSLGESNKNILENGANLTPEALTQAVHALVAIEAQIQLSDRRNIDLISYSSSENVISERRSLDIEKAKMKVALRKLHQEGKFPIPEINDPDNFKIKDFDSFYDFLTSTQENALVADQDNGITAKDRIFNKMKGERSWKAARVAFGTGLLIGTTMQEIMAIGSDQIGIGESLIGHNINLIHGGSTITEGGAHHLTSLAQLKHLFEGNTPAPSRGLLHEAFAGAHIKVPVGSGMVHNPDGTLSFFSDGKKIAEHLTLNPDGTLTQDAQNILHNNGVTIDNHMINGGAPTHISPEDYVRNHPGSTHEIHRAWYDNDTPKPVFDKNELRTLWGGEHGTGINADGKYVLDISHMTPDGSFHAGLSADAQELMLKEKLKMLISMSTETQNQVFEVEISPDGKIIVDPGSEIGKMFFATDAHGHAQFMGRFGEIGQDMGENKFRMLSTIEGPGLKDLMDKIPVAIPEQILGLPGTYDFDMPPFIPLVPRTPLEKMQYKKFSEDGEGYYGYGYGEKGDFGLLNREQYEKRFSKKLLEDRELDLSKDDSEITQEYLDRQDKKYLTELERMISGIPPISPKVETIITVPAYQEGANIEKTIRNYAKLNNRDKFELVILENHPKGTKRDDTASKIAKLKLEYPDMNIVLLYKEFESKPAIGNVRKYLVDAVLLRKRNSGISKSIAIASNDADLEDINPDYANEIAKSFRENPELDALGGKWDYPEKDFEKLPILHASQRLWHYFDIVLRYNYLKSPELIGRNSAFRSGIYAAIGGYNQDARLAEDLEIGWMIKKARNYDASRISYSNRASLVSNSRRAVVKMLSGGALVAQYGDFHENEEVRKAPLGELLKDKRDFDIERFKKEVQSIYDFYKKWKKSNNGWVEDKIVDEAFERAMGFLGVKYTKIGETIELTDTSKLISGLEKKKTGNPPTKNKPEVSETRPKEESSPKEKTPASEMETPRSETSPEEKTEKTPEEVTRTEQELEQEQAIVESLTEKEKKVVEEEMRNSTPDNFEPPQVRQDMGLFLRNQVAKDASGFTLPEKTRKIIRKLRRGVLAGVGVLALWASTPGVNGRTLYVGPTDLKDKVTTIEKKEVAKVISEQKDTLFNIGTFEKLPESIKNIYLYASAKKLPSGYVVVDKPSATMFVFSKDNKLVGTSPVILGKTKGESPNRADPNTDQPGLYSTTPAGRYTMGTKLVDKSVAALEYEGRSLALYGSDGLYVHEIYPGEYAKRKAAMDTPTTADNRMSWGCINIDKKDYDKYLKGIGDEDSVIYITPDNENYTVNPETGKIEFKNTTRIAQTTNNSRNRRGV